MMVFQDPRKNLANRIAYTLLYLPENEQQWWLDMLRLWELGKDADPGFSGRIEFHNPTGKVYVARRFGREEIFGKTVELRRYVEIPFYLRQALDAYGLVDPEQTGIYN